jgi:hypothetical protein
LTIVLQSTAPTVPAAASCDPRFSSGKVEYYPLAQLDPVRRIIR